MLSRTALGGIWIYQQFISPRKGFRCAHAVLHNGTGCSGYAKQVIKQRGLFGAIPFIRQRFQDCKTAYLILRTERNERDEQRRRRNSDSCAKQVRDGCCDETLSQSCDGGSSCLWRAIQSTTHNGCNADCGFCSCG